MSKYGPEIYAKEERKYWSIGKIRHMINSEYIVSGRVSKCDEELNLYVDLDPNVVCVIAKNEIEETWGRKKKVGIRAKVGRNIKFKMTDCRQLDDGRIEVTGSRKLAQQECMVNYVSKLVPGDIIPAAVSCVEDYGIFCDIGCGITALLPSKNISATRVLNLKERARGLTNIYVIISGVDDQGRIELSHKELLGTWEEQTKGFSEGETIRGVVSAVEGYGIFVDIAQNVAGLATYAPDIAVGDSVSAYIRNINNYNMKIKLTIISHTAKDADDNRLKFDYKNKGGHMDRWVYSPEGCSKVVESVFVSSDEEAKPIGETGRLRTEPGEYMGE